MDISKKKAVVSFDYDAEAKDELTLRVGDVLANLRLVEEGWCEGSLNGKTGVFPDNFVKLIDDTSAAAKPTQSKRKKDILRQMRASFPYERQNDDELDLAVGDIIDVLHDEEKGWATGSLKGREGVFPTNFAELYTGDTSSAMNHDTADDPDRNEEPVKETGSKKVKGVGFGNIFTEGPIKLKPSSFNEPDDSKMDKNQPTKPHAGAKEKIEKPPPPPASQKKPKLVIERCRATFDYEAQTEDELSLVKGDIIVVTNKSCEDAGWWEGEVVDDNGRKRHGMFPDNFVAMLPNVDDETEEKPQHKESKQAKPSIKPVTKTEGEANTKDKVATTPAIKLAHSLKRPAPQIPPAVSKPSAESSVPVINDTGLLSTSDSATDSKLTHYKRASGPKNRRKPDSAGRRERASAAAEPVNEVKTEPHVASEPKKVPTRPAVALQPPKPAEPTVRKPMAAVKPKPPPPKAKPALPGAKPIPHPHPDAMKDELKALKDLITNVQDEHRKEINRLTKELEEERKQRFFLQDEVAQLRKQVG
ncbi:SH3 domain-containing kinase-binding protein 1-like isoform X3 [Clavelina lepadiformis]|uniref:SH3 domain-containing kinase-binding protein 1-like isoform X3 n=1 Tax=Clavelina lepadiformis TaxID=159417 RepID=UPI004042C85A